MESSRPLDAVGCAAREVFSVAVAVLGLTVCWAIPVFAQDSTVDLRLRINALLEAERWPEVVETLRASPLRSTSADLNYSYGTAAAQLGQWNEARSAFLTGIRLVPRDPRFPVELGGVAYRQNRHAEAAKWLRRGVRLTPDDPYAHNFLATVYLLNGNLEAALKYWNRIGHPQIENVRTPGLQVRPELLDRAFTFAPAGLLRLSELRATKVRLNGLSIFSAHNLQLVAREDGKFDVDFRASERNGTGAALRAVASTFRGVLWQTIYLDYYNIARSAMNLNAFVRWDPQKRWVLAEFSQSLHLNPKYRLRLITDLRNENWDIRELSGLNPILDSFNMRRQSAEFSLTAFSSDRLNWSIGAEVSHRDYRNVLASPALAQGALLQGYQLKHLGRLDYDLLRMPERRITSTLTLASQIATIWSRPSRTFEKLQMGLLTRWFPQMSGEDYATEVQFRYRKSFGDMPFDELYTLGLERDIPLFLRGHSGVQDGRRGRAPLGRNYFLANLETDKIVYRHGLVTIALSPFLDIGRVTDPVADLGSRGWLYDTGMQVKFRVWGFDFRVIYGKDLQTGRNAYFLTTGR
jgi:tetratricopeptide (TPR) repeat protein